MNKIAMKEKIIKAYKDLGEPVNVYDMYDILGIKDKTKDAFASTVYYYYRLGFLKKISPLVYQWQPSGPPNPAIRKTRNFEERRAATSKKPQGVLTDTKESLSLKNKLREIENSKNKAQKSNKKEIQKKVLELLEWVNGPLNLSTIRLMVKSGYSYSFDHKVVSNLVKEGKLERIDKMGVSLYRKASLHKKTKEKSMPNLINVIATVKDKPMEVAEGPKLSVMSFEILVNNPLNEKVIMDDIRDVISEIEDIKHVETRPAVEGKDYKAIVKVAFKK